MPTVTSANLVVPFGASTYEAPCPDRTATINAITYLQLTVTSTGAEPASITWDTAEAWDPTDKSWTLMAISSTPSADGGAATQQFINTITPKVRIKFTNVGATQNLTLTTVV